MAPSPLPSPSHPASGISGCQLPRGPTEPAQGSRLQPERVHVCSCVCGFPCECVGVCSHTCRLQELIMVSSPCGSGLARNCGRKQSAQGRRRGQLLAALGWDSRTGWAAKVRSVEAPRGCGPLGDRGPGPWAEPGRWVPRTGTKDSPQSCSVMNLALDRQWAPLSVGGWTGPLGWGMV